MPIVVLIIAIALVAGSVAIMLRRRSVSSSVDSFRRHIDALGPEARRNVVDQVQSAAGRDNEIADTEPGSTDESDEGGTRGT